MSSWSSRSEVSHTRHRTASPCPAKRQCRTAMQGIQTRPAERESPRDPKAEVARFGVAKADRSQVLCLHPTTASSIRGRVPRTQQAVGVRDTRRRACPRCGSATLASHWRRGSHELIAHLQRLPPESSSRCVASSKRLSRPRRAHSLPPQSRQLLQPHPWLESSRHSRARSRVRFWSAQVPRVTEHSDQGAVEPPSCPRHSEHRPAAQPVRLQALAGHTREAPVEGL